MAGLLLFAAACNNSSTPAPNPVITGDAVLSPNPNAYVPLAAVLQVTSDVPTRVELDISDPDRSWHVIADPNFATAHVGVPVLGLRPDRLHHIDVQVVDQQGRTTHAGAQLSFTTPPLPAYFPPLALGIDQPANMEAGVTLLVLSSATPGCLPAMVDAQGQVVWYFDCSRSPIGTEQTLVYPQPDGNLMLIVGENLLIEIDVLGNVLQSFSANRVLPALPGTVPVDVDSFHHDFVALPPGLDADYAVLCSELRQLPNYPANVVNPSITDSMANVVGDVVVEFRRDGTVVRRFPLMDLIDPYRVSYDSLGNFWDSHYGMTTRDWSHANALVYDAPHDSWLVSLRHQDAVLKIARSGALDWILGDPARWNAPWNSHLLTLAGGQQWQYHQHGIQLLPDGTLHLFDNGVGRAVPPVPQLAVAGRYSRALQYQLDPVARSAQQIWSYGEPPPAAESFYSFFVSSAYRMPQTGNVLVCDGGRTVGGVLTPRVFEVTGGAAPERVFELTIGDAVASWFCYRAYRLPALQR